MLRNLLIFPQYGQDLMRLTRSNEIERDISLIFIHYQSISLILFIFHKWDLLHRDRTRASTLCFFNLFFSAFEHVKGLLIMGPNNTKNSSLKCDFHIINYE
jgi:hypothetical protein